MLGTPNILAVSDTNDTIKDHPETAEYIEANSILAYVITRVADYGFIVVIENNISRMWQESDLVLLNYLNNNTKLINLFKGHPSLGFGCPFFHGTKVFHEEILLSLLFVALLTATGSGNS